MTGALAGTRVVDLAQGWAGPGAAMYLGDQGADVIKVEPLSGDAARGWYPSPALQGTSRSFLAINRNKRSIALDAAAPEGTAVLHRLLRTADVVIVNQRPATARRLGIEYADVAALNPRIVYANLSAYGEKGPYAGRPAYDHVIQGVSGVMDRRLPDGTPLRAGAWVADLSAPMLLAYGVTLALLARERTGEGQRVDTSLLQAAIALNMVELVTVDADPQLPELTANPSGLYACADSRYINALALTERQLVSLCTVLDRTDLLSDPRFLADNRDLTVMQRLWREELASAFLRRDSASWLGPLMEADVPCGPVLRREEVLDQPQAAANQMRERIEQPGVGRVTLPGVAVHLASHPGGVTLPAPSLGEHTDTILSELGYDEAAVAALRGAGVVA